MPLPLSVLLYLQLLTMVATVVDDQPYCALRYRRLCQGKGRHVGCQFPEPGPSEYCVNYTKIKFNGDVQKFITNYLNRRRQRIASGNEKVRGGVLLPTPGIMMLVEWDRELAFLAQRFADQCNFAHDECRATVRYPYAGQTVGEVRLRRSSESDDLRAQRAIRRVFDAWWGEKWRVLPSQLMTPFKLTPKGTVWGHFSQLAVWTLRAVGCGAVRHGKLYPHLLLVCDFSHTNMLGQRTLSPGPIAPCPLHTARKPRTAYPLLCAAVPRPVSPMMELQYDWEFPRQREDHNFENEEEGHKTLDIDNVTKKYEIVVKASSRRPLKELYSKATMRENTLGYIAHSSREIADLRHIKNHLKATIVHSWDRTKEEEDNVEQNTRFDSMEQKSRLNNDNSHFDNQNERRLTNNYPKTATVNRWDRRKDDVEQKNFDTIEQNSRLSYENRRKFVESRPHGGHDWYSIRPQLAVDQLEEVSSAFEKKHPEDVDASTYRRILTMPHPSSPAEISYEPSSVLHDSSVRHRWKYTKDRPKRPGAKALLNKPSEIIQIRRPSIVTKYTDGREPRLLIDLNSPPARAPPPRLGDAHFTTGRAAEIASLLLDKEDVDQFIRDTGFNPQWRAHAE